MVGVGGMSIVLSVVETREGNIRVTEPPEKSRRRVKGSDSQDSREFSRERDINHVS